MTRMSWLWINCGCGDLLLLMKIRMDGLISVWFWQGSHEAEADNEGGWWMDRSLDNIFGQHYHQWRWKWCGRGCWMDRCVMADIRDWKMKMKMVKQIVKKWRWRWQWGRVWRGGGWIDLWTEPVLTQSLAKVDPLPTINHRNTTGNLWTCPGRESGKMHKLGIHISVAKIPQRLINHRNTTALFKMNTLTINISAKQWKPKPKNTDKLTKHRQQPGIVS